MAKKKNKQRHQNKTVPRCEICGFRKRGKNHEEGQHHQGGSGGSMSPVRRR